MSMQENAILVNRRRETCENSLVRKRDSPCVACQVCFSLLPSLAASPSPMMAQLPSPPVGL